MTRHSGAGWRAMAALVCAGIALLAAAHLEHAARDARPSLHEGVAREDAGELPPVFRLVSSLMGSFRALIVDVLWIRADVLQTRGQYFAASELARWITALQSRVEGSWSFQAWNLGVNVPGVLPLEARWPYVKAAMDLLWRGGLGANPSSLGLHYELAWFWEYKIGGDVDPAAPEYRRRVAAMVREILGPPPWDPDAYVRGEALLPELARAPEVREFLARLEAEGVAQPARDWMAAWRRSQAQDDAPAAALRSELERDPVLRAYDRGLRARAWKDAFGIDMRVVRDVFARYGPLDPAWPESFVLFWTQRALAMRADAPLKLDTIALMRMRIRALLRLFRRGMPELADAIDREYADAGAQAAASLLHAEQAEHLRASRIRFLREGIPLVYLSEAPGTRELAAELYARLRRLDPENAPRASLEEFALAWLLGAVTLETTTRDEYLGAVRVIVREGVRAAARGEQEDAGDWLRLAREMYAAAAAYYGASSVPAFEELAAGWRRNAFRARAHPEEE